MLYPKVKEPFFRFVMFGFFGGFAGVTAAIVLGILVGFLLFLIAKIQGDVYSNGMAVLSLLQPGMPIGALLGTLLGAVYGIVRKGE